MKTKKLAAAVAAMLFASGCADFTNGLAALNDEMQAEQGNYFPDEHHSQSGGADCPTLWEYGRVNNRSYQRVRNTGSRPTTYTLIWSTGSESSAYLAPGETSEFFYMTPSVIPENVHAECG